MNPETIPVTQLHRILGAHPLTESSTRFCVWSPNHDQVHVVLVDQQRKIAMQRQGEYHIAEIDDVGAGCPYQLQFGDQQPLPDPTSRFQRDGVHGPSRVVDPSFAWGDNDWRGVARDDLVIYELHVGTFTQKGTFLALIDRLDELVSLGVTAIELMPVADCAGRWNWGYDGVNLFAPNRNYGSPDDFRRLVDAAHSKGVAVLLDVVYNHLGPEGNYLGHSGPYLSTKHNTVWGSAPNFDDPEYGPQLRRFFIANAIHWFDEYHIDGLRVDAIHCMRDDNEPHVVIEMSQAVQAWSRETDRPAMLIAESNVYDPQMLAPLDEGGIGFTGEWCDDFLHSVFAVVRPGEQLCHRSYKLGEDLDQTLRTGFVYEGTLRDERGRRPAGDRVDTRGLIYSIQHHDFIGNHPLGMRLHQLTSLETQRAAAALLLLSPGIPMLFMGEEFACENPFQFFVDFGDEGLRTSVVEGRQREYPQHDWSNGVRPIDPLAFTGSKIGPISAGNRSMWQWYQSLIQLRKEWRAIDLLGDANVTVHNNIGQGLYCLQYQQANQVAVVAVRLVELGERLPDACDIDMDTQSLELLLDSRSSESTTGSQLLANHAKIFVGRV